MALSTALQAPSYFNSRPSARGDMRLDTARASTSYFNSRPSARGDPCCWRLSTRWTNFNSRPSARGDHRNRASAAGKEFQFTPLREGRRRPAWRTCRNSNDFNSRPSARGDRLNAPRIIRELISIHAPPRGATGEVEKRLAAEIISIHAPPRGATAKDMQFLQIFCSTLTNQHGLTIVPGNLSRLFW